MSKSKEPSLRVVSILVAIMVGCVLAYAYQLNLPTLFYETCMYYETYMWASLVIFVTIPVLVGFISGLLHPAMAIHNGLYAGFFTGLFNSISATIKLIYAGENNVYPFALFNIMSIFMWAILSAAAAMLAQKFYE